MENDTGASWANWFQSVSSGVVSKAADAAYVRPYDIAELRLMALGSEGYYTEGQAGAKSAISGGISPTVLLLGGVALVAVFLLKD